MEQHHIGRDAALATLRLTQSLLERHGPRIAGTRQCLNAADQIADMFRIHCDKVSQERFDMHPGSFWNVGKVMAIAYLVSGLFLAAGGTFVFLSSAVSLIGLVYGAVLYIFSGRLFDPLFPRVEGCNVFGVIEPSGEVKQQIILSGHHDSSYVLSFLLTRKRFAHVRLLLAIASYVLLTGLGIVASVNLEFGGDWSMPALVIGLVTVLGLLFVFPLYFVITRIQSPGAGDNLNATAMAITTAVHFDLKRKKGTPLKHTRLIFLSTDGEEVGQRGAIEYAERHKTDLLATPTFVLNIDSVYALRDLTVVTRDRNGTRRLSRRMAKDLQDIAAGLGYSLKVTTLPLGGGGTDAAAFAAVGVESSSIIGISTHTSDKTVYHTPNDTVEHIESAAVEATLDLAINYIMLKDHESEQTPTVIS